MNKHPNRFETTTEQARRNFEEARRGLSDAGQPSTTLERLQLWASRQIAGGKRLLWIVLGLILLGLFVWWLLPSNSYRNMRGMGGPQPVGVAVAQRAPIDVTLDALGAVTPLATVTVRPQVSGQIIRFDFREGQMVKPGDVLAEIDPRPFQASLEQAKGQLARDTALLSNAQIELKRQKALRAANATSQQNYDNQLYQVKQYEGVVKADQANVDVAAINLGYTKVTAPIAGRAGIRLVDVGNFVSAGQTSGIVVVTQLQPISVLFTVPEDNVQAIIARLNAGEDMPVEAWNHNKTAKLATGRLTAVDSQVDTSTGTVKMRAMFGNDDGMLFPAQFVNVKLLVDTVRNQVVIPAAAVQRGASGTFVWVVKADHTASMRTIVLGPEQVDSVAVAKGLNVGETVVTDGGDRLREGGEVTIPSGQKVQNVKAADSAAPLAGQAARDVERAQRRAAMQKACGDDIKKVCAGAQGRAIFMCLNDNADKLSPACQAARKAMRSRRSGGGEGGPPPGGHPPGGPPPGGP